MHHRLARLQWKKWGWFRLLAMDHGLTVGSGPGSPDLAFIKMAHRLAPLLDGIVLTPGIAAATARPASNVIVQCFGAPRAGRRVQIADVELALGLDAAAVSVQIDLQADCLSEQTREISSFTASAHRYGLPVLFMATGFSAFNCLEILSAVRACHELGADLIKLEIAPGADGIAGLDDSFVQSVRLSPPLLLAGGEKRDDMIERFRYAKALGFSGYCVGRSVFRSEDPASVLRGLNACIP